MDNLQYIRDAIKEKGNRTPVTVVRWEMNPSTGAQDHAFKLEVNARIALRELQKPINKRSFSWSKIRPLGDVVVGRTISAGGDMNSLSNPELLTKLKEEMKAQVRAEMEAELAAETEEKPKRKKKVVEEVSDEPTLDTAELFESFSNPQI
jgi:hypothetical protein